MTRCPAAHWTRFLCLFQDILRPCGLFRSAPCYKYIWQHADRLSTDRQEEGSHSFIGNRVITKQVQNSKENTWRQRHRRKCNYQFSYIKVMMAAECSSLHHKMNNTWMKICLNIRLIWLLECLKCLLYNVSANLKMWLHHSPGEIHQMILVLQNITCLSFWVQRKWGTLKGYKYRLFTLRCCDKQ